ncbi:hypothetical protein ThimaDRAFT_1956 [Thiocapsa marina 5811]|uniref:Uncharacterized protein n=1 Tax=Thiocapsa marina 5811 TaxID=768671 RepID=F9UAS0_9GAMM|nr:hypothetical protein ThimaDRAFT_1956 [Thiocapsa marina 5811]
MTTIVNNVKPLHAARSGQMPDLALKADPHTRYALIVRS